MPFEPNELRAALLAASAMNPWPGHDSSSRIQMFMSHVGQALNIAGCTIRRCMSGVEREFGKYTFNVKMPTDAFIVKVIDKYPQTLGMDSIKENPRQVIIYQDVHTKEYGIVDLTKFHCEHQHFGFRYKQTDALNKVYAGSNIGKDVVLADSPAIDEHGNYRYGVEAEVAFMSVPAIIEDGVVVRRGFLEKLAAKGFESRVTSWGKNRYPLNLYGDENNYKPFPDIGDRIRPDGLLFALRSYDEMLSPVEMTPKALMEPDYIYDKLVYAEPGARVIDISINHDLRANVHPTPIGMTAQTDKYHRASCGFYQNLMTEYHKLKANRKDALRITPQFQRLLFEAQAALGDPGSNKSAGKITYMYRRNPLDDYRVDITYEYDVKPTIGYKITGCHGDKGVICDIWDDEDMPVDANGNRADFIMDGDSTIKRMNIGRMYEQYYNATSRDISVKIRQMLGVDMSGNIREQIRTIVAQGKHDAIINEAFEYVLGYYKIISPMMYDLAVQRSTQPGAVTEHVMDIVRDGIYIWLPTDNPAESVDIVQQLRKHYPIHIGPVTYKGRSGNVVQTESPILIGSIYVMLLEKTGVDWSGTSSSKLQHFGIPAKLTAADKNAAPGRQQPVRIFGESEVRLGCAATGGDTIAEVLDQSNNPAAHKHIVGNILRAEKPTAIANVIDRQVIPRGNSRALVYLRHILECAGVRYVQKKSE